jgi:hypothetical protein
MDKITVEGRTVYFFSFSTVDAALSFAGRSSKSWVVDTHNGTWMVVRPVDAARLERAALGSIVH